MAKKKKNEKEKKLKGEGRLEKGRGNVAFPGYMVSANAFLDNIGLSVLLMLLSVGISRNG